MHPSSWRQEQECAWSAISGGAAQPARCGAGGQARASSHPTASRGGPTFPTGPASQAAEERGAVGAGHYAEHLGIDAVLSTVAPLVLEREHTDAARRLARPLLRPRPDEVGGVPQTHRAVLRAGDQAAARQVLRDRGDALCVLLQRE